MTVLKHLEEKSKALLEIAPLIGSLDKEIAENLTNPSVLTDCVWLCRKLDEVLDSLSKQLHKIEERSAAALTMKLMDLGVHNWKTDKATATPNPDFYVKFPVSPKDDGFEAFVEQLPSEAVRPHFPTVTKHINEALGKGEQIPFGLKGIKGVIPKIRVLSRKELCEKPNDQPKSSNIGENPTS